MQSPALREPGLDDFARHVVNRKDDAPPEAIETLVNELEYLGYSAELVAQVEREMTV